jgi:ankyrin repeat protein
MLRRYVQVDAADNAGCSALHLAAQHGHTTTMRLLLVEGNADSSVRDELGGLASRYCDERVWQRLQEERPNRRK